jgi:hypothetical protein
MAELKRFFGDQPFQSTIPRNIRLAEAPSQGKPVLIYDVRSRGAESYIRLAKEIISRNLPAQQETPATEVSSQPEPVVADQPIQVEEQPIQSESLHLWSSANPAPRSRSSKQ